MDQLLNLSLLSLFIPTFLFVSATPGMCMTLSLTLGMSIGVKRTLWMMAGELCGVAIVSIAAVLGVASLMLNYPGLYLVLKYLGAAYLVYLGVQLLRSRGNMAIREGADSGAKSFRRSELAMQGFVTAIANPKGWAFMVSLLPPFIDTNLPMPIQLSLLVLLILIMEFCCLLLYAGGGVTMRRFLEKSGNVRRMNAIAGLLMVGVGLWLAMA